MSEVAPERWHPRTLTAVPTGTKSLEAVAEDARQKGYNDGFSQGQADARKQGEKTASELAALWRSMQKPIAHQDQEVSEHLLSLVVAMSKSVLQRELEVDVDLIAAALEKALNCLADAEAPLTVVLNPADKAVVENLLEEGRLEAELVADTAMLRGGCRVQRGHALVDATIESRVADVIEQIARAYGASSEASIDATPLDPDRINAIAKRFSSETDDD
mgnify:FL=1